MAPPVCKLLIQCRCVCNLFFCFQRFKHETRQAQDNHNMKSSSVVITAGHGRHRNERFSAWAFLSTLVAAAALLAGCGKPAQSSQESAPANGKMAAETRKEAK